MSSEYAELRKLLKAENLLDDRSRPMFYIVRLAFNTLMVFALLFSLPYISNVGLVLINAVLAGFFMVQCLIIGHDAMHHQLFRSYTLSRLTTLFIWNFLGGVSHTWYADYHGKHHVHANRIDVDPNLEIPFALPGRDDVRASRGIKRLFYKHQSLFLFPFLLMYGGDFVWRNFRYVGDMKLNRASVIELFVMGLHYLVFLGVPFAVLPFWQAVLYLLVFYGVAGFYAGVVFVTNHFGMPVFQTDQKIDYLQQQARGSRNIRSSPFVDYLFAGLNFQIEHHLFPTVPRYHIYRTAAIVKAFCVQRGIPYHDPGLRETFREMADYLREGSAPLRERYDQ